MAEEQNPQSPAPESPQPGAAAAEGAGAQFLLQKLYLKDVSFESPGAPGVFNETGQPDIGLNMAQNVANLGDNNYEITLTVTVTCKVGEKTAYLAEVKQAGVFHIAGFQPPQHGLMVGAYCPNVLFPYARQVVSDLVLGGGFAPLVLQPINFEQIYAEQIRQRAAQAEAQGGAPATGQAEGIEGGNA